MKPLRLKSSDDLTLKNNIWVAYYYFRVFMLDGWEVCSYRTILSLLLSLSLSTIIHKRPQNTWPTYSSGFRLPQDSGALLPSSKNPSSRPHHACPPPTSSAPLLYTCMRRRFGPQGFDSLVRAGFLHGVGFHGVYVNSSIAKVKTPWLVS